MKFPLSDVACDLHVYMPEKVRIVYFDESLTADDADIMAKLGLGQYFAEPLINIPVIKLTGTSTSYHTFGTTVIFRGKEAVV